MFRLRWLIVPLWMGCVSCAVIIAALSAGWYDWQTFVVAAGLAVVIGVPAGILTTRYLRTHPRDGDGHGAQFGPPLRLRRGQPRPGNDARLIQIKAACRPALQGCGDARAPECGGFSCPDFS